MPSLSINELHPSKPLHRRILTGVRGRVEASRRKYCNFHKKWKEAEERAIGFLPEREYDALRRAEREEGKPHYTTIQMPYSYAVLMTSHTYWTTVFMSRNPVLQIEGLHGEGEMQVQAMEALMNYQMQMGEMLVPLYIWLLDAGKYGAGVIYDYWDEEYSIVSEIKEVEEKILGIVPTGKPKKIKTTRRIPGYHGNKLQNVRPFDFFPDPRVTIREFQKGDFCALYQEVSWAEARKRERDGYYFNLDKVRNFASQAMEREEGSDQLELPNDGLNEIWDEYSNNGDTTPQSKTTAPVIPVYECFMKIVPKEWNLGNGEIEEKWVFTVAANYSYVIGARPLGAYHDRFPFSVMEMEPEGYSIIGRGVPQINEPIQNTLDWLINSHFYNVRAALNNQIVVDPSRVVMKDVLNPLPGGVIRLKPEAYGTDTRAVWSQFNIHDMTQSHMGDLGSMLQLGERINGVNDQIMGVVNTGGRKTATEVRTSSSFGVNRLKTNAEYMSAMGWGPLTRMMVQNTQQYYDMERKFRIAGDFAQLAGEKFMNVTPDAIRGFYDLVPVDGTLPVDRFAQANLWQNMLAQIRNYPEVAQTYDVSKIFAWVAQLAGLKNINQFRVQVIPDAMMAAQAQQGNVVPIPGGVPAAQGPADPGRAGEPGQVPNVGATA